jgi:hypothetical protein
MPVVRPPLGNNGAPFCRCGTRPSKASPKRRPLRVAMLCRRADKSCAKDPGVNGGSLGPRLAAKRITNAGLDQMGTVSS